MRDCQGNEDEKFCKYFAFIPAPSEICSKINRSKLEQMCPSRNGAQVLNGSCSNPVHLYKDFTLNFLRKGSYSRVTQLQMDRYCIYDPNICGIMEGDPNGEQLLSCELHTCPTKYYKCPGYYCIPWRFVCNGEWECPGGQDEIYCQRNACPGMYRCKNSSIGWRKCLYECTPFGYVNLWYYSATVLGLKNLYLNIMAELIACVTLMKK